MKPERSGLRTKTREEAVHAGILFPCLLVFELLRGAARVGMNQKKCERRGFDLQDRMEEAGMTYADLTAAWKEALV
jgi:hypothetical protein